jgi:hypothetical protein
MVRYAILAGDPQTRFNRLQPVTYWAPQWPGVNARRLNHQEEAMRSLLLSTAIVLGLMVSVTG